MKTEQLCSTLTRCAVTPVDQLVSGAPGVGRQLVHCTGKVAVRLLEPEQEVHGLPDVTLGPGGLLHPLGKHEHHLQYRGQPVRGSCIRKRSGP